MKKYYNNKGMTMVEIIVSIALVSIVLILLMNLFLNVNSQYNNSKLASDYEVLASNVLKSIGDDIEKYGVYSIEENTSENSVKITYNAYRESKLNERITKILRVYSTTNSDGKQIIYISYRYDSSLSSLTSKELSYNIVRQIPNADITPKIIVEQIDGLNRDYNENYKYAKITIPLVDMKDNKYDIHIYCEVLT